MPTAFVTGGSGFIGGALVRRVVAEGVGVRALTRSDASAHAVRATGAEPVPGDIGGARAMAVGADGCEVAEAAWRALPLPGRPPLTRLAVWLSGLEVTIDVSHSRTELGYAPARTVDERLAELADEARRGPHR